MRRTRFDQSSPVQPVSDFRAGYPERDGGRRTEEQQEILVSNIEYSFDFGFTKLVKQYTKVLASNVKKFRQHSVLNIYVENRSRITKVVLNKLIQLKMDCCFSTTVSIIL